MTDAAGGKRIVPAPIREAGTFALRFPADFTSVIVEDTGSWMQLPERLTLYTLMVSLQPTRVLEIGVCEGGSSRILVRAMDDVNRGHLFSVDPEPRVKPEVMRLLGHRMMLKVGRSPDDLPELHKQAGGGFDFVFIDGDHMYDPVVRDIHGVLSHLADEAYLVFHDAYYIDVRNAIDHCISENPEQLQDCGMICRSSVLDQPSAQKGYRFYWGGMRLVAFSRSGFSG